MPWASYISQSQILIYIYKYISPRTTPPANQIHVVFTCVFHLSHPLFVLGIPNPYKIKKETGNKNINK